MHDEPDVPVLNSIIKVGNESIIESTRLGREVLEQLEAMKSLESAFDDTLDDTLDISPADIILSTNGDPDIEASPDGRPGIGDGSPVHLRAEAPEPHPEPPSLREVTQLPLPCDSRPCQAITSEETLELMIDELVDRHVSALRADLRRLLLRAQKIRA